MKGILVEHYNHGREQWESRLLNTGFIVSVREHDLSGKLTVCEITMSNGDDVIVKDTLKSLYHRIALADDKDFVAPTDVDALTKEWLSKRKSDTNKFKF